MRKIIFIVLAFGTGIAGGLIAVHLFSFRYIEKYLIEGRSELVPIQLVETREVIVKENEVIIEAVERIQRAVIGVKSSGRTGNLEGSGIILSSDGLVVTLANLIPAGASFSFHMNGETVSYEVQKRDLVNNLALVKVEGNGLPTLEFADTSRLKNGERVFLTGAVFGAEGNIIKSVNEGIIKRTEEGLIITNITEDNRLAGSALFDIRGRVLGINLIGKNGEVTTVPISTIREFVGL